MNDAEQLARLLGAQHAWRYVAPRLALVGDAAHGVHPIHAQGFNMGVADIGALVAALCAARARGLDPGSGEALLPYARRRRGANTQRLWLTDGLVRIFTNELPPVRAARSRRPPRTGRAGRCATSSHIRPAAAPTSPRAPGARR